MAQPILEINLEKIIYDLSFNVLNHLQRKQ